MQPSATITGMLPFTAMLREGVHYTAFFGFKGDSIPSGIADSMAAIGAPGIEHSRGKVSDLSYLAFVFEPEADMIAGQIARVGIALGGMASVSTWIPHTESQFDMAEGWKAASHAASMIWKYWWVPTIGGFALLGLYFWSKR